MISSPRLGARFGLDGDVPAGCADRKSEQSLGRFAEISFWGLLVEA
jgi:hypothetical protein